VEQKYGSITWRHVLFLILNFEMPDTMVKEGLLLEKALKSVKSNPAIILKLRQKGWIDMGNDAEIYCSVPQTGFMI
jgi:alpha-D-ribose 1-methylphosphonate 5-triphosphate diphosphatase PhnM